MTKAIFYKEWLKTRRVFWVALVVAVCFAVYAVMSMNRVATLKGCDHIWLIMLLKDNTFIDVLQMVPLVIGIAVGVAQMAPEMAQKRLKLTLHLPYPQMRLVALMLLTGIAELIVIFAVQMLIIAIYDMQILASQLVSRVLLTSVPWYICGINAYMITTAICLEGTWRQRVLLGLLGVGMISFYFMQPAPEAYNSSLWLLVVVTLATSLLSFRSVNRFKEGRQD